MINKKQLQDLRELAKQTNVPVPMPIPGAAWKLGASRLPRGLDLAKEDITKLIGAAHCGEPLAVSDALLFSQATRRTMPKVLGAKWEQIDLIGRTWSVPSPRGTTSSTVLSDEAMLILHYRLRMPSPEGYVFTCRLRPGPLLDVYVREQEVLPLRRQAANSPDF